MAIERDAAEALAERSEGNLLACAQEIDKLCLLTSNNTVSPLAHDDGRGASA